MVGKARYTIGMTISNWLVEAMIKLKQADVPNGRTDALILLADLFDTDKSWIHTHPEQNLDALQIRELNYLLQKRIEHVPLAYIMGRKEFYGRDFMVNSHVLIPRPESEAFIELLRSLQFETARIADIGTGSGCLGITAALEIPDASVDLYDIDTTALAVARHNADLYGAEAGLYESDLLANLQHSYDILLANLPYVPDSLVTSPEITKEPAVALFSGKDGLNHYRTFWQQVSALKDKPSYILTESLESQLDTLHNLAIDAGYELVQVDILVSLYARA